MSTFNQAELLGLFEPSTQCAPFLGGAKSIFVTESQLPILAAGKEVLLISINSPYVKAKSGDVPVKSSGHFPEKVRATRTTSKVTDEDGWTQITRGASGSANDSPKHEDVSNTRPMVASTEIPVDQNKFMDLLVDASESFFHDEEQLTPELAKPDTSFLDALNSHMKSNSAPATVEIHWMYLDPNGEKQGPFTGTQMSTWLLAGYFPKDLPVSWFPIGATSGTSAKFRSLGQVYPNVSDRPFLDAPISPNSPRNASPKNEAPVAVSKPVAPVVTAPPASRGWLWSPEDDMKLANNQAENDVLSLASIMQLEAANKKTRSRPSK